MNKSIRDGFVTGMPATLIFTAMLERGVSTTTATLVAVAASAVVAAVYRLVRARWPWLLAMDAPGGTTK